MLSVSRRILVSAPRESVRRYLSDLREIAHYDAKVDTIHVPDDGSEIVATGHFLGFPWQGKFRFESSEDGGYVGTMTAGSLRRMECRVSLRSVSGGTRVEHEELYELPFLMRPFQKLIRRWLDSTLETELDVIKERAEALNRRLHLQSLDA